MYRPMYRPIYTPIYIRPCICTTTSLATEEEAEEEEEDEEGCLHCYHTFTLSHSHAHTYAHSLTHFHSFLSVQVVERLKHMCTCGEKKEEYICDAQGKNINLENYNDLNYIDPTKW